jgi:hypothetical protein
MLYYRVWNDILPKLEPILRRSEDKRLSEELDRHVKSQYWMYIQRMRTDAAVFPHWPDARKLPSISEVLKRRQENLVKNYTIWRSIFRNALVESKQYAILVKKDLVKLLERASPSSYPRGESLDDILNRASSIFQCVPEGAPRYNHTRQGCQGVYGYPDIVQHLLSCNFSDPWDWDLVRCDRETAKIAALVLKNLNMPIDTPRSTTEALDGKFMCLCGHPNHLEGTSFDELVRNLCFEY